mmetsp:Transcript_48235/g.142355  ORF Transcript_48235/g.142355 Transcript_48235/m.142355 type:complete len:272 (+) Transcript_48235:270-1085(+)
MFPGFTPAAATFMSSICFMAWTCVRTETSSGMTVGTPAAAPSAPRLTCTRIWIGIGCFEAHAASGCRLPSSSLGFLAAGSSSESSSIGGRAPGRAGWPGALPAGGGGATEALGSLALTVDMPVMGPAPSAANLPPAPAAAGDGSAAWPPFFSPSSAPPVGLATMVCAGPASAPASRAEASAPASAASAICSSTEPNRSGLLATKPAKLASTSSANADSFRARSTSASFWCFHLGSRSRIFRWFDISSAGMSWPVMGQRCIALLAVCFLWRT